MKPALGAAGGGTIARAATEGAVAPAVQASGARG
jgi:hypothetical protein